MVQMLKKNRDLWSLVNVDTSLFVQAISRSFWILPASSGLSNTNAKLLEETFLNYWKIKNISI